MKRALIIVDVQYDFLPGGALGVTGGDEILPVIRKIADNYDFVIATQDWHPKDHISFSEEPMYQDYSWPVHCVQNTQGAMLSQTVPGLNALFRKGADKDLEAYSGFDGFNNDGLSLNEWLAMNDVREVDVVGLALDYCVKATALDAEMSGFKTHVLLDATRSVNPEKDNELIQELTNKGVFVTHSELLDAGT